MPDTAKPVAAPKRKPKPKSVQRQLLIGSVAVVLTAGAAWGIRMWAVSGSPAPQAPAPPQSSDPTLLAMASRLESQVKDDPGNAELYVNLAVIYERLDRSGDMQQALRTALRLDPKNATANLRMGYWHWQRREYDLAVQFLQRAAEASPNEANPHIALGQVFLEVQDGYNAAPAFERARALEPTNVGALLGLSAAYFLQSDLRRAQAALDAAATEAGDHPAVLSQLARLHLANRRYDEARLAAQRARQVGAAPQDVIPVQMQIELEAPGGDPARIAPALAQVIQGGFHEPHALALLADAYTRMNQLDDAIALFEQAVTAPQPWLPALPRLAEVYRQRGHPEDLTRAAELLKSSGQIEAQQQALRELSNKIAANPGRSDLWLTLSRKLISAGAGAEAALTLQRAVGIIRDDPRLYDALAEVYRSLGRTSDAEAAAAQAAALRR